VPVEKARRNLVVKAYPFRIEILSLDQVLAVHTRSYTREQDVIDPLHYLPLLEQRPGAFEHAKPIRRWRERWPQVYEQVLALLQAEWPQGRGVREFVRILRLHQQYPAELVEQAVEQALTYGCVHVDGVQLCLHGLTHPEQTIPSLALDPTLSWAQVGAQPITLNQYNQLLQP